MASFAAMYLCLRMCSCPCCLKICAVEGKNHWAVNRQKPSRNFKTASVNTRRAICRELPRNVFQRQPMLVMSGIVSACHRVIAPIYVGGSREERQPIQYWDNFLAKHLPPNVIWVTRKSNALILWFLPNEAKGICRITNLWLLLFEAVELFACKF